MIDDKDSGLSAIEEAEASLACEGIYLTQDEKALMRQMEADGLSDSDRIVRLKEFIRKRR